MLDMLDNNGIKWDTLWWTYKKQWKDPPFLMGKSTISTGPFSIAMLVHQRVMDMIWQMDLQIFNGYLRNMNISWMLVLNIEIEYFMDI